jgi:hypothetical protein
MSDIVVGSLSLGTSSKLVFSVSQWRGNSFANIRKFVTTQKYEGPTKSGLFLGKLLHGELVTALTRLEKTIPSQEQSEIKRIPKSDSEYIKITILPADEVDSFPAVAFGSLWTGPRIKDLPSVVSDSGGICFRKSSRASASKHV